MKKILISAILMAVGVASLSANTASCVGCHGSKFEKVAMGKSKVVKDMSLEDIQVALKGYKDGTYGGSMKGLMKGFIKNVSDTDTLAKEVYEINHDKPICQKGVNRPSIKPVKTKCLAKLKSIEACVNSAVNESDMQTCRKSVVDFAEKIKTMHKIK